MLYVVEISTNTAGQTAKGVTEKQTLSDARMVFHQALASMLANENVVHGICTILNNDGRQLYEYTEEVYKPVAPTE